MCIHGPYSPEILIQKSEERVKNLHFYQEVCILTQVFQESQYNIHRETTSRFACFRRLVVEPCMQSAASFWVLKYLLVAASL